jgi:hypothetical protein
MNRATLFVCLMIVAGIAVAAGCAASGPAPLTISNPPPSVPTPAAGLLYVDHNGMFYEYALPLSASAKPIRTLVEWPKLAVAPAIAADQYGNVAVVSPRAIRLFKAPITSFEPQAAKLQIELTPAITPMGPFGADLADVEFDPNQDFWLLNNLGGAGGASITMIRPPLTKHSIAALSIGFGEPGSKTAGYTTLVQARFDVNASLYVYASPSNVSHSRLFKVGFPYAKPPSSLGLNLAQAYILDASEWPPTAPVAPSLLLGQYLGQLRSPKPGSPPSPPVDVTAQFPQPFNPTQGQFPNAHVDEIVGALVADPYRYSMYTLDAGDGSLDVYTLPMGSREKPKLSLRCPAGPSNCSQKFEHLFLAP